MNKIEEWLIRRGCMVRMASSKVGRQRIWFTRNRSPRGSNYRHYHVFSLGRVISSRDGTAWQLIIGPLNIMWGHRDSDNSK